MGRVAVERAVVGLARVEDVEGIAVRVGVVGADIDPEGHARIGGDGVIDGQGRAVAQGEPAIARDVPEDGQIVHLEEGHEGLRARSDVGVREEECRR